MTKKKEEKLLDTKGQFPTTNINQEVHSMYVYTYELKTILNIEKNYIGPIYKVPSLTK